jgi:carboxymethylenebutenolidase
MRIELPSGTPAELVTGTGNRGVVICPDIGGLRPLFDDLATSLSSQHGWSVCVIEPFPYQPDSTVEERVGGLAGQLHDERVLGDMEAAAEAVGTAKVAAMGFCMGGMYALKAAGTGRFDRCVAFYGMIHVPEAWRGPGQGEPLDALARRSATEVMAIVGELDHWTPPSHVDELEAAGVTVARYPQAEHGFVHDASRPAHRAADAADAWARVVAFLGAP